MRKQSPNDVIAIHATDLHLSHNAPIARKAEPDWYEAMRRQLNELRWIQIQNYGVPILYTGDIFHSWQECPELVNFAIQNLPKGYAVPGQHDLPFHDYGQMHRSCYWTLVEAGVLINLEPASSYCLDGIILHAFPWGYPITPCPMGPHDFALHVAMIHEYICTKSTGFPGVSKKKLVRNFQERLKGYDIALFGDNHKGFIIGTSKPVICNGGGFMRRHSDQKDYQPFVSLILRNGEMRKMPLDCRKDLFTDMEKIASVAEEIINMSEFVGGIKSLGKRVLDFGQRLEFYMKNKNLHKTGVGQVLTEIMELVKGKK